MTILNNKKLIIVLKFVYLGISLLCYFKSLFDSFEIIDNIIYIIRDYLPIIGLILIMFTVKIKIEKNSSLLYIILFLIYCFATVIGKGNVYNELIILAILAILFKDEDLKYLFRFILVFFIIFMSFNISLSYLQILPYNTFARGEIIRHSFNFRHPNSLGLFSLSLYTLICYVLKKYKIIITLTGILLFHFVYYYVNSRTSGLLILLLLVLHIIYWLFAFINSKIRITNNSITKCFKIIIISLPIICFIVSLVMSYAYSPDNSFLVKLDELLSGRIYLQNNAVTNYGMPLFGTQRLFSTTSQTYDLLDSYYLLCIYRNGLIFELAILGFISYMLYKNINRYDLFIMFWVVLVWCLHAFSEPLCLYFCFNPFLLLLFNKYQEERS